MHSSVCGLLLSCKWGECIFSIIIQWNLRIADGLGPLIISFIRGLGLN